MEFSATTATTNQNENPVLSSAISASSRASQTRGTGWRAAAFRLACRRCVLARSWNFEALVVCPLLAARSAFPKSRFDRITFLRMSLSSFLGRSSPRQNSTRLSSLHLTLEKPTNLPTHAPITHCSA